LARCGLVTDIELFDDFPARYHAYARREHRWIRGDWQLLPWLGRRVPRTTNDPAGPGSRPNPLPLLERWKILDNLRRSLVPPALIALLVLGWTVLPGSPWIWTAAALAVPLLPLLQMIVANLFTLVQTDSWSLPWLNLRATIGATGAQAGLTVIFLADQARQSVDAVARTLARLFVTRRHLLEWETAFATERRLGTALGKFWRNLWPVSLFAVLIGALVGLV